MYRIVKRIIHTVTTVTLLVRWEKDSLGEAAREVPITLPASVSLREEEVSDTKNISKKGHLSSNPNIDKGEYLMSTLQEQNKALVRRIFEEGINQNNQGVFDELIAPSYVNHDIPGPTPGSAGFKMVIGMFLAAFPHMRVTIEEELAEGNKVITRGYFTGTHQGDFQGIPPTGKQIQVKYIDIWLVENGKLVENWVRLDELGMMQQLGVIPTPG